MLFRKNSYIKQIFRILKSQFDIKDKESLKKREYVLFDELKHKEGFLQLNDIREYSVFTMPGMYQKPYFEYLILSDFHDMINFVESESQSVYKDFSKLTKEELKKEIKDLKETIRIEESNIEMLAKSASKAKQRKFDATVLLTKAIKEAEK